MATSTSRSQQTKAARVLRKARELATRVESWADFCNALFDAEHGYVAQVFPALAERQAFFQSKEHAAIDRLLGQLMERFGVADGATPTASGPCLVELPRALRLALEQEAAQEGVSFQQLLLAKLTVPLAVRSASGD